jgi:hypothetical protein
MAWHRLVLPDVQKRIRMANTACDIAQQHFACFRPIDFDRFNFKRFAGFPGNSGTGLHSRLFLP